MTTTNKLPVPEGVLKQHVIILGKTGAGKSSVMRVLAEHLLGAPLLAQRLCIVDPKGDWWGIKSSANGKDAGLPVAIFGGEHAEVPITPSSGAAVAKIATEAAIQVLIDLGGWMVSERTRFFLDFAPAYFRAKGLRYLMIDEVHHFCPKGKIPDPQVGRMLHWSTTIASEGRGRGITLIAASQRPQKVHNDFLTQCETLVAMKATHPADMRAYRDWIEGCGDISVGKEVMASLAGLPKGTGWVWSPEIGFGPVKVPFPRFRTYDSFAPQIETAALKGWHEVDLGALREQFAAEIKQAEENDPRVLHKRIRELEQQAGRAAAPAVAGPSQAEIEDRVYRHVAAAANAAVKARFTEAHRILAPLVGTLDGVRSRINDFCQGLLREPAPIQPPNRAKALIHAGNTAGQPRGAIAIGPAPRKVGGNSGDKHLSKAERKFLTVLAQRQGKRTTRNQVAIFAGYSTTSGHVDNTLGALRSAGCAEGGGEDVRITAAGLAALGDFDPLPTGEDLRRYWLEHAGGKAERAMLEVILKAYPETLTRDEVAEAANYNVTSGHVDNTLGRLRSMDLIKGPGSAIRASEDLFA